MHGTGWTGKANVIEYHLNYPLMIMTIGALIVLTMLVKSWVKRIGVPPLVGFLLLGLLIRLVQSHWGVLGTGAGGILDLFAKIGLITLLFRVGLESNLRGLLKQLRSACLVWVGNVLVCGLLGFVTAFYFLSLEWATSIIVATAFTATSVGISVAVWNSAEALNSPNGELLIDVAELDDISAVVLMALVFALLPQLENGGGSALCVVMGKTAGGFLMKLFAFGLLCFLFSRFVEKPITTYLKNLRPPPDFILVVTGIGFIIASLADLSGFSLAIGAFFAGLVFSRDDEAVKREGLFIPLYELFSPFFFVGIGMLVDPHALGSSVGLGAVLTIFAFATKIIANGLPVWILRDLPSGSLIGVSMVPRAEIAMVIMSHGLKQGALAVPPRVFNAMVLVCILTCTLSPIIVNLLLTRWPQTQDTI